MADGSEQPKDSSAAATRLRLFVAINLPPDVQSALGAIQQEAPDLSRNVRWALLEQLHLTLKFLGPIDAALVPEIEVALSVAVKNSSVMTLRAEGIGCFPNPNRPRILWAGIAGELDRLLDLQSRVEKALNRWVEPEKRPYAGHVTLARITELPSTGRSLLKGLLVRYAGSGFGKWQATKVDLMQSVLSSRGSVYKCLASITLRERGVDTD
jgi:2'-5' RNA ligase